MNIQKRDVELITNIIKDNNNGRCTVLCDSIGMKRQLLSVVDFDYKRWRLDTFRRFMEGACQAYPERSSAASIGEDMDSLYIAYNKLSQMQWWQGVLKASYAHVICITDGLPNQPYQHNFIFDMANIVTVTRIRL